MRGSCDFIIEIDMAAAIKDGIKFFISTNNVILSFANIRRAFYLKIMIVTTKFRVRGRKDNHFSYTNNVILTEGIDGTLPPKYFKKVTERK
jgi:RNA:NAD 2'-phosphotransferase (TPT1/KptA family)